MMDLAPPPGTPARSIWIARPWVDLLVGCGGWSLPLLAVSYGVAGAGARQWSAAFYTLALVANYPHYMATVYRAYGRSDRSAHRRYTVYGTAMLVALAAFAHVDVRLLPWLFTAYVMWSPWHYTGQNYGLLMMFLGRAGLAVTPMERRRLRAAFVASYVMLLAAFNEGVSADPLVISMGLPPEATRVVASAAAFVFLAVGLSGFVTLARRARWPALVAPSLLFVTQGLWFVVPTALAWTSGLAVPQTRYSSGVLAMMHSAQYLWITQYFARREQGAKWVAGRYWLAVIVGGMALFLPVPWVASLVAHVDFTASMLIVTAVLNLHHFMLDGVVWKLREPRIARVLTAPGAPDAPLAPAPPAPLAPLASWARLGIAAVSVVLVALAGLDQWRYRLASRPSDPAALQAAVRLNPYDSGAQDRLLRILVESGRNDEARVHLEQAIAAQPDRVGLLVNAGVLARRTGRDDDAARYWTRALDRDGTLAPVQLYLAELFDAQGRTRDAVPHYRAYLELVVEQQARLQPNPAAVVPVVLKFAEALGKTGRIDEARTQFELAAKMARQTGLKDLEHLALQRLATAY